jgi:putative phosphotransacetylase
MKIPIEISARHVHLAKEDLERLFGQGYQLKFLKKLSQADEFAAQETLTVVGPKAKIENVRIIGPIRDRTQVEISRTDGFKLGDIPPLRVSGDVIGSSPIILVGPKGEVRLKEGLICAKRHIHISLEEAKKFKVKDKQIVSVKIFGTRTLIFHDVVVRVKPGFKLAFHIDTDEANAAWVEEMEEGEMVL